jgi:hypothetical protein
MTWAPLARIALRYIVGGVVGMEAGDLLAGDPDIVFYVAMGIGAAVEAAYTLAKNRGWTT